MYKKYKATLKDCFKEVEGFGVTYKFKYYPTLNRLHFADVPDSQNV
jgi:hypothetical protein